MDWRRWIIEAAVLHSIMRAKEGRRDLATSFTKGTENHALSCMKVTEWINLRWDGQEGPWNQSEIIEKIRKANQVTLGIIARKRAWVGGFHTGETFEGWWFDSHGDRRI